MAWLPLASLLGLLLVLMFLAMPVAFAFLAVNMIGAFLYLGGEPGLTQLPRSAMLALSNFTLTPIPLFLLMGEVMFHTGVAQKAIDAVDKLITRVPGRLSVVSVLGGTLFASLSGSTLANTAMLGSLLLPDMMRRGYHPSIAMGPIMATGGIAMLIPPSALAVLLGSLAGISVSKLLIAGIMPGLMMSALFLSFIVGRCAFDPCLAPAYDVDHVSLRRRAHAVLVNVIPLLGIFAVVVGSIVAGWATPTESAALGCVASIVAAAAYGQLSWRSLITACRETALISVMVFTIIMASVTFSQILGFSGATDGLLAAVQNFGASQLTLVIAMVALLLLLGCFIDQVSMILLTIPFYMPLAQAAGIDPIWLGVLILVSMEIGLVTPPFGMILFVMKGVAPAHITMRQVYAAVTPFIVLELLVLAAIIAIPALALWLPDLMIGR